MIERLIVIVLLVVAGVMYLLGHAWFALPLVLGVLMAILVYRMENKRYSVKDDDGYYVVVDAELDIGDR